MLTSLNAINSGTQGMNHYLSRAVNMYRYLPGIAVMHFYCRTTAQARLIFAIAIIEKRILS